MANDRMILAHRPTGRAIVLAKTFGWHWGAIGYLETALEPFFVKVFDDSQVEEEQSDFVLLFECSGDIEWDYDREKIADDEWKMWIKWENEAWRKMRDEKQKGSD